MSALDATQREPRSAPYFFGDHMLEADLSTYMKKRLELSGLISWRVSNGPVLHKIGPRTIMKKSHIAGFPDWAGITPSGRFWALELKTDKGRIAPHQQEWINRINQTNGIAEVARSFDEIDDFILRMKKM